MKGVTVIFFNDTAIASTDMPVTYSRETYTQKEYRITDIKRSLTASFYSESEIKFIENEDFLVEIL